jgi:hypothetical protein
MFDLLPRDRINRLFAKPPFHCSPPEAFRSRERPGLYTPVLCVGSQGRLCRDPHPPESWPATSKPIKTSYCAESSKKIFTPCMTRQRAPIAELVQLVHHELEPGDFVHKSFD